MNINDRHERILIEALSEHAKVLRAESDSSINAACRMRIAHKAAEAEDLAARIKSGDDSIYR